MQNSTSKAKAKPKRLKKKSNASSEKSSSEEMADALVAELHTLLKELSFNVTTLSRDLTQLHTQMHASAFYCVDNVTHGNPSVTISAKLNTTPLSKRAFRRNGLHFGHVVKLMRGVRRGLARLIGA